MPSQRKSFAGAYGSPGPDPKESLANRYGLHDHFHDRSISEGSIDDSVFSRTKSWVHRSAFERHEGEAGRIWLADSLIFSRTPLQRENTSGRDRRAGESCELGRVSIDRNRRGKDECASSDEMTVNAPVHGNGDGMVMEFGDIAWREADRVTASARLSSIHFSVRQNAEEGKCKALPGVCMQPGFSSDA